MFCTNCGHEIEDDMKFCTKCGTAKYEESLDVSDNVDIDSNRESVTTFKKIKDKAIEFYEAANDGYWIFGTIVIIVAIIISIFT